MQNPFAHVSVLVFGDMMLDIYRYGEATRISPEAPVPVVRMEQQVCQPGGAAHVAMNLAGLSCQTHMVGRLGKDEQGQKLLHLLTDAGVHCHTWLSAQPTITKERIMAKGQQMIRLDQEPRNPEPTSIHQLPQAWEECQAEVWICSDYGKGSLSPEVLGHLYGLARKKQIPVLTDPKHADWTRYRGTDWITPNWKELCEALGQFALPHPKQVEAHLQAAALRWNIPHILVTLSEQGMAWYHHGNVRFFEAKAQKVYDVSGAGDTVVAVLAAGIAAQIPEEEAIALANQAAGLVVAQPGTIAVQASWLFNE
jgi:D-beta-D-heptose 7-phosphate kinase / D-beta-D-heptose 1-phosphate adenosyltransferase